LERDGRAQRRLLDHERQRLARQPGVRWDAAAAGLEFGGQLEQAPQARRVEIGDAQQVLGEHASLRAGSEKYITGLRGLPGQISGRMGSAWPCDLEGSTSPPWASRWESESGPRVPASAAPWAARPRRGRARS